MAARGAWMALAPYPEHSIAMHRGLAECYLGLGDTLAAAEQWELAYAADPSDPSLWHRLAPAHLSRGEWQAAARAYGVLLDLDPENSQAAFWYAVLVLPTNPDRAGRLLGAAVSDPVSETGRPR